MFTTCQLAANDCIYMIGGVSSSKSLSDFVLLPNCKAIDADFNIVDKAPMKVPRCSIPLAVVRDRFILTMGGFIRH